MPDRRSRKLLAEAAALFLLHALALPLPAHLPLLLPTSGTSLHQNSRTREGYLKICSRLLADLRELLSGCGGGAVCIVVGGKITFL